MHCSEVFIVEVTSCFFLILQVYAVECSDIAVQSREAVARNGYEEVIEVIQDNVKTVSLPHRVDWIISEWMGTLLLVIVTLYTHTHTRAHTPPL